MFVIQEKNPQKWVYIDNTGKMRLVSARCFFIPAGNGPGGDVIMYILLKGPGQDDPGVKWKGGQPPV